MCQTKEDSESFPKMVTYMTENFVNKLTHGINPYFVTKITTSGKNKIHKINVIENLNRFTNLQYLTISHNRISKISGLEKLVQLKHLNLSWNCISSMNGLENLKNILSLDLTGNALRTIPLWISKKLCKLKTLHIAENNFNTLDQLYRLRGLCNLTNLSFLGNPAIDQLVLTPTGSDSDTPPSKEERESTYRLFALFHLRALLVLDGKSVQPIEFELADKRFGQAELSNLTGKIRGQEERVQALEQMNATLEQGLHSFERRTQEEQEKRSEQAAQIDQLTREIHVKDQLLQTKSNELARACLKYYELEQELAFHKIDSKLAHFLLGPPPSLDPEKLATVDATGNYPYLGRCRFRRLPVSIPQTIKATRPEHVDSLVCEPDSNNSNELKPVAGRDSERSSTASIYTRIPRCGYMADCLETMCEPPNRFPVRSEQSEDTALGLSNRSTTPTDRYLIGDHMGTAIHDANDRLQLENMTDNHPVRSLFERGSQTTGEPQLPHSFKTTRAVGVDETDLQNRVDQLKAELQLAWSLTHSHRTTERTSEVEPTTTPCEQRINADHSNNGNICLPPSSPRTRSATGTRRIGRERSTSLPGPESANPRTAPVQNGSVCSSFDPEASREPVTFPKARSEMDCESPDAIPLHFSGTSSTPSSRTTGTGRSVIPLNCVYEPPGLHTGAASDQRKQTNTSSSESHADLLKQANPADWCSKSVQPQSASYDRIRSPVKMRKPGVGLSQAHCVSDSTQSTEQTDAIAVQPQPEAAAPSGAYRSSTRGSDRARKTTKHFESSGHQIKRPHKTDISPSGQSNHQLLNQLHPQCSSSSNNSARELCARCNAATVRDSVARTSASGASMIGLGSCGRKRRVPRSLSLLLAGGTCRPTRLRATRSHRRQQRDSTDTLEGHAEELLNMLVMSRKACASEVDKMRADLAWIQRTMPRLHTTCGHVNFPHPCLTDGNMHNSSNHYGVLRDMDSRGARADGCGTVRSYMDSLTNITRPSPNCPHEMSSFGDADDDRDVDDLGADDPYNNYNSAARGRPSGEPPTVSRQCDAATSRLRGRRLLPDASSVPDDEERRAANMHESGVPTEPRANPTLIPFANQWTPDYIDLDRIHEYGGSPVRGHARQASSIPRDFHRTASQPIRSNAYSSVHRRGRNYLTRASAPGLIVSPSGGSRPPRGRSLDPVQPQQPSNQNQHRPRPSTRHTAWMNVVDHVDDEDPSTETAALLNLTEELVGLRQGLKQARRNNAGRLEMALRQINLLELELQRQRCLTHDAENARERQIERSRWERRLSATLAELKQCQVNIGQLRAQMDQLAKLADQNTTSQTQFEAQKAELNETKSALDAQKEEITRLNRLLNKLLGVDPSDASPSDLAQIQAGLVELNRTMQAQTVNPIGHLDPVRRTQSLHTGLSSGLAAQPLVSGLITPTRAMARSSSGNLYCNVPEHHYLEDCMDQLQTRLQESQTLQTEQQKKLRQTTKAKRKLEKQLEEKNANIAQLASEVTAQNEELTKVAGELKRLAEEKENTQKAEQLRLTSMATDMSVIETAIKERRLELASLENKLQETQNTYSSVQVQAREAGKQLDNTRANQSTLESSLNSVQVQIKSCQQELAELQANVNQSRVQAQKFDSTKQQLADEVKHLEETIRTKQTEFQNLSNKVTEVDSRLIRIQTELDTGDSRLKAQQKLMTEDEAALNERRVELRRLSQKIIEDETRLESLAREIGEQRTELELIQAKQQRDLDAVTQGAREASTKAAVKQRELAETQSSLNALMDERAQLTAFVESLRAEQNTLQLDLQEKQKTLTDLSSTLLRQRRELEHTSDMARLEETRLHELTSQQREVLDQLHKLQAQVRAESSELRGRDVAKLKKDSELQVTRSEAEHEQTELQRLVTERRAAEAELAQLQQETSVTRTQLNNMRQKVKELEKQEAELLQSISEAQRQLSKIVAEREAELISLRGLRHERASCQTEYEHLSNCLDASRAELERTQKRLSSAQSAAESQESDLTNQQRRRIQLTDELAKLGEAVHLGRLAKQNTDDERESSESALQVTRGHVEKAQREKLQLEEEVQSIRRLRESEKLALEERLSNGSREIDSLDVEVAKKTALLKSLNEKVRSAESRLAESGRSERKLLQLEQRLEDKDRELKHAQKAERQLRTKLGGHGGDSSSGPVRSSSASDLARLLEETKAALIVSQRDSKRLKRRTTRELTELERIAEEQSHRAAELTEQLALVKRQYAQLKGQISTYGILMDEVITVASQTELSEHGRRLEVALAAVRAELEQNMREDEEALFRTDPTTAQALYGGHRAVPTGEHQPHTTSDLHRSLLVLTNSFHDLCHPSATTTQPHSRSLLTPNDFHRSTSGLYRPVLAETLVETTCPVATEVGESTTGTCRTGTTSGLGSSLNPTASMDQRLSEMTGSPQIPQAQDEADRRNGLREKLIDRVAKQREQNSVEWEQSNSQFRLLHDQVDRVRGQLARNNTSTENNPPGVSRRR